MRRVVFTVAGLVMAVREDGQRALRMRRIELGLLSRAMECLLASIKSQIENVLLDAAYALGARVAVASAFIDCGMVRGLVNAGLRQNLTLRVTLVFVLVLVLLVAAVTLGVMGLGLARTATVLALLDRTTLRVDVVKLAI